MGSKIFDNRYEVLSVIQMGGLGSTYLGWDHLFKRLIVIKELLPGFLRDNVTIDMFQNEIIKTLKIIHKNIVQIYAIKKTKDNTFYIMMEYINGIDLKKLIKKSKERITTLPIHLKVFIIEQICQALDHVYNRVDPVIQKPLHIIPSEISPSDVIINSEGTVKLLNLGFTKDRFPQKGEAVDRHIRGKIPYMSPEQIIGGENIDCRSNVFSLGVCFYELLTGTLPYKYDSEYSLINSISKAEINALEIEKQYPQEIVNIIKRALRRLPDERYQSVHDLLLDLASYLSSQRLVDVSKELKELVSQVIDKDQIHYDSTSKLNSGDSIKKKDKQSETLSDNYEEEEKTIIDHIRLKRNRPIDRIHLLGKMFASVTQKPISAMKKVFYGKRNKYEFQDEYSADNKPPICVRLKDEYHVIYPMDAPQKETFITKIKMGKLPPTKTLEIYDGNKKIGSVVLDIPQEIDLSRHEIKLVAKLIGRKVQLLISSPRLGKNIRREISLLKRDLIDCTLFSPSNVTPGEEILIQAFIHLPLDAAKVERMATLYDESTSVRGRQSLNSLVARGSELLFQLNIDHLKVKNNYQKMIWRGQATSVQFQVEVPNILNNQSAIGNLTVIQDTIPIGMISFKINISSTFENSKNAELAGTAIPYNTYFISYASQDRTEVLKRVQMLKLMGKKIFQDILNLDPGVRWKLALEKFIDLSDATLLFWSTNAKNSEWVIRECRYTIDKKGIERLIPVIIEGPPPVKPPPELSEIHFNDNLLYFMNI